MDVGDSVSFEVWDKDPIGEDLIGETTKDKIEAVSNTTEFGQVESLTYVIRKPKK